MEEIINKLESIISNIFNITIEELRDNRKLRSHTDARSILFYFLHVKLGTNKKFKKDEEEYKYKHKRSRLFEDDEDDDSELFEGLEDKFIDTMESLKEECPEMYHIIKFKLYEMINGPHFTKDLCEEALECVIEDYKVKEAEFEYEESKQVAKKFGVEFEDFNEYDWHYALNICYHLFKDICKDDIQMCAKLTYLWLCDKAIPEGKAFYHYMKHLKHKHKEDRD